MSGFRLFNKKNECNTSLTESEKENHKNEKNNEFPPPQKRYSVLGKFMHSNKAESPSTVSTSNSDQSCNSYRENSLPPLSPLNLLGYKKTTKHKLLDEELANNIRNVLPDRLQLFDDWELVYSLEQHGISLNTLYQNCDSAYQQQKHRKKKLEKGFADSVINTMMVGTSNLDNKRPQGYVMIIKDEKGSKFGCFVNENLKPMHHKRYYGNGECFLWKCEEIEHNEIEHSNNKLDPEKKEIRFKAFMYTGVNDNIIYSSHDFIAIGSSNGQNGLWIDKSLYKGVSYSCETFGNEILNKTNANQSIGNFKIMGLEIWRIGTLD